VTAAAAAAAPAAIEHREGCAAKRRASAADAGGELYSKGTIVKWLGDGAGVIRYGGTVPIIAALPLA